MEGDFGMFRVPLNVWIKCCHFTNEISFQCLINAPSTIGNEFYEAFIHWNRWIFRMERNVKQWKWRKTPTSFLSLFSRETQRTHTTHNLLNRFFFSFFIFLFFDLFFPFEHTPFADPNKRFRSTGGQKTIEKRLNEGVIGANYDDIYQISFRIVICALFHIQSDELKCVVATWINKRLDLCFLWFVPVIFPKWHDSFTVEDSTFCDYLKAV